MSTESMDLAEEELSQVEGMSGASEDEDECVSSPAGSTYEEGADSTKNAISDEVTKQLAAAGPVGMAAAAAIASSKKRKRPHSFETNPSVRKRHQNRLLRKLRQTIEEFATRVGQQAVVLVATPGKPNTSYRVFGAKPLEDVVRNLRCMIMEELENALAQQAPPPPMDDPSLFELPPLIIDGIPTPVEKMTQAQLRAFIPLMLKYSMGSCKLFILAISTWCRNRVLWPAVRGKPGWGRESTRPPWWPKDLPWANVRMDARTEDEKQKMSQYAPAVLQTITNPDGTVSLIQVDPNNPIITLPDGTTAQVIHSGSDGNGDGSVTVDLNAVAEATLNHDGQIILTGEDGQVMVEAPKSSAIIENSVCRANMVQQILLSVLGLRYKHIHRTARGYNLVVKMASKIKLLSMLKKYFQVVPLKKKFKNTTTVIRCDIIFKEMVDQNGETLEAISMSGGVAQVMLQGNGETQVLQVLSLKDATVLTKAMQVKSERDAVAADS
ncbi:jg2755 [Pararge aegeria aegeria]|uniref:Jg2755 protein n=1 Tax=Pararge aegeria aegeria TaxID=348720 RepID=A0A8S4RB39_9NEOP|nr:jg2755 [Pararge aegeria aegeria]